MLFSAIQFCARSNDRRTLRHDDRVLVLRRQIGGMTHKRPAIVRFGDVRAPGRQKRLDGDDLAGKQPARIVTIKVAADCWGNVWRSGRRKYLLQRSTGGDGASVTQIAIGARQRTPHQSLKTIFPSINRIQHRFTTVGCQPLVGLLEYKYNA